MKLLFTCRRSHLHDGKFYTINVELYSTVVVLSVFRCGFELPDSIVKSRRRSKNPSLAISKAISDYFSNVS